MARDKGQRVGAYGRRWLTEPEDPVAKAIAAARRKDRRTQAELAEDLGIKRSRLAQYERGARPVPWELWGRLTEELEELIELDAHPTSRRRSFQTIVELSQAPAPVTIDDRQM